MTDRVVMVTGGSRGIGRDIVLRFLKNGAIVICVYARNKAAVDVLRSTLSREERERFFSYRGSINDRVFLDGLFNDIRNKFYRLDILVNNAGITRDCLFLEMSQQGWNDVLAVNLKGTFMMSVYAAQFMKQSRNSGRPRAEGFHMINMSSISGVFGREGQANYACSKGAIIGLTRLLAKTYEKDRIHVNAIAPGFIRTKMMEHISEGIVEQVVGATVLKRMGTPRDVAGVVLFLTSPAGSYISGAVIKVDGGYLR